MGQEYEVSSIVIHNRPDCCEYQNGYALVELYNDNGEVVHLYSLGDTTGVAQHTFDAANVSPTTQAPTTQAPTTQAPTTQAPTTASPTTQSPTTQAPTLSPTTQSPTRLPTQSPTPQPPSTPVKKIVISQDGPSTTLTLSEVQVFAGPTNVALQKNATQSSTYDSTPTYGPASFAVDGDADTFNHVDITANQVGTGQDTS